MQKLKKRLALNLYGDNIKLIHMPNIGKGEEMEAMTDKQMEFIANLIADKFEACTTMEEVREAAKQVREMVSKDKKDKEQ